MVDIPFGVSRLDSVLDGGVPAGSVVVLATEPGAGGRKFAHTSAAMNALATADNERFERYYRGMKAGDVIVPAAVQYCCLAATHGSVEATLRETVSEEIAASASQTIEYHDLSPQYFSHTDVPPAWYLDESSATPSPLPEESTAAEASDDPAAEAAASDEQSTVNTEGSTANGEAAADAEGDPSDRVTTAETDAGSDGASDPFDYPATAEQSEPTALLPELREFLSANAAGNLVVLDAITDLATLPETALSWDDATRLVQGLTRAAADWGGLVLLIADSEAVTETQLGRLSAAATGTLRFGWETGGSERARVLDVRELRGALSRLERENIAQFESELHDRGYDLSNVRKIR